jgi:glutamyl-Q tRNA(Asp) synthetase
MTPTPAEFKSGAHVGRFAPSPTGPLHFGSLVAAFGSFLRARSLGGRWLLRIEDIDTPRVVPGAAQMQMDALLKLGLEWDGDPMWQSQRDAAYRAALQSLQAAGLVFACRCSRSELAGEIHRQCVSQREHGPAAIRLRLPDQCLHWLDGIRGAQQQNLAQDVGDVVLWRADGLVAYQLAVVVDDAAQGITEVVRGADLLDSSARQIHLHRLLGHTPPAFAHLPLALDAAGHKLGKSQQALAITPARPMPMLRAAWAFLGQNPEVLADVGSVPALLDVAIADFDWSCVPSRDQTITELAD